MGGGSRLRFTVVQLGAAGRRIYDGFGSLTPLGGRPVLYVQQTLLCPALPALPALPDLHVLHLFKDHDEKKNEIVASLRCALNKSSPESSTFHSASKGSQRGQVKIYSRSLHSENAPFFFPSV